jgi:MYXO-CTERM domain-containing protein
VCCSTACGGAGDRQACNLSGSAGSCAPLPVNTACRAANGVCDVAESCDGAAKACPADGFVAAPTSCWAASYAGAGQCQLDGDCVDGFICSGGNCAPEQDNGESCGGDSEEALSFSGAGCACTVGVRDEQSTGVVVALAGLALAALRRRRRAA